MSENNDLMSSMLLDDRIKGLNFFEIGEKHGIKPEEARAIVNEALSEVVTRDPVEMRGIIQLRLERMTQHLWTGIENGSFKHIEAATKIVERIAELMDLNEQTIKHQISIISDEETLQLFHVLRANNRLLYDRVRALPLNQKALGELESWPEWAADAAGAAVDEVIVEAEVINVGATGLAKSYADRD